MSEPPTGAKGDQTPARRRGVVAILLVLATLLGFVTVFSLWINRQALNTDNWTSTSTKLLESKDVQTVVANYLVDQLYANVDVQGKLATGLPPRLTPLAGPLAGAIRELATKVAQQALANARVQQLWSQANRAAHQQFITIVEGGGGAVSTTNGKVTLDLGTLVEQVGTRLGISGVSEKLPPDVGQVQILKSDQISLAQDIADAIRSLAIVLLVVTIALYALAIYLGRGRRRQTLRAVGLCFIGVGIAVLAARSAAGNAIVDALSKNPTVKPAADDIWSIATSLLRDAGVAVIINGTLIFLAAWLAGPTRLATGLRHAAAPYLRDRPGLSYGAVAVVFLLLAAWGPTPAFRSLAGLLIIAALMAFGTGVIRRQTAAEFPNAQPGDVTASIGRRSGGAGAAPAGAGQTAVARAEAIERLGKLRTEGLLTDEEFQAQKAAVLSG